MVSWLSSYVSYVPSVLYRCQQKVSSFQLQRNRSLLLLCRETDIDQQSNTAVLLESDLVQLGFNKYSGSFSQQYDSGRFKSELYYFYLYAWCKTFSFKYLFLHQKPPPAFLLVTFVSPCQFKLDFAQWVSQSCGSKEMFSIHKAILKQCCILPYLKGLTVLTSALKQ